MYLQYFVKHTRPRNIKTQKFCFEGYLCMHVPQIFCTCITYVRTKSQHVCKHTKFKSRSPIRSF